MELSNEENALDSMLTQRRIALSEERARTAERTARRYRQKYESLLATRWARTWMALRSLAGKPYTVFTSQLPNDSDRIVQLDDSVKEFLLKSPGMYNQVPRSDGSAYFKKSTKRIGIICDRFVFEAYNDAAELCYLNPQNYKKKLDSGAIDFVLYVSTWRGLGFYGDSKSPKQAHYFGAQGFERSLEVLRYARKKQIPIVFQSKEDPVNYERFLEAAKLSDSIFTSAVEMVDRYRRDTQSNNVHELGFGINPRIHNPIGFLESQKARNQKNKLSVLFAGAWYNDFSDRCADAEMMLDGVVESRSGSLFIADRNYFEPDYTRGVFPDRYEKYTMPSISYDDLQRAYKCFDVILNLNSVTTSESMCAMRLYEVQAAGGLILSNSSKAVERIFPHIAIASSKKDVIGFLDGLQHGNTAEKRISGIRKVFDCNTVYDRLNSIFASLSFAVPFPEQTLHVIVDEYTERVERFLQGQHTGKTKIEVCQENKGMSFSEGMWIRLSSDVIDRENSNAHYLSDMVNAFKYTDAAFVSYEDIKSPFAYNYIEKKPDNRNTMFDSRKVPYTKQLEHSMPSLEGFAVCRFE